MTDLLMRAPASLQAVFAMAADQEAMRETVRAVLARSWPLTVAQRTGQAAAPDASWQTLCDQGLVGALVPERWGGAGLNYLDAAVALEEAGRVLLPAPLLATTTGVAALLAAADPAAAERYLPGIADGRTRATLALAEHGRWTRTPRARAVPSGDAHLVTGAKELVLDGAGADLLIVSAVDDAGPGLYAIDRRAGGVTSTPVPTLDHTRALADVSFTAAPAQRLGAPERGGALLGAALARAVVLLAAEQIGGARHVLDLTVGHAKDRVQYGRSIGSFQAVKHRVADMLIAVEYARAMTYYGAWAATSGPDELGTVAPVLKNVVGRACVTVAESAIQVHGGTGFTWEHVAHLFYKRALSDRALFGMPDTHLDDLADQLGI